MSRCMREGSGQGDSSGPTDQRPLLATPLAQGLVAEKGLGNRATECLRSPLPPAHPQGFTLGQLEPEVAFKQLD